MITYINSLNIIKNAMILKKIRIKIKSDFKTKNLLKILKNLNLILNTYQEKNYIKIKFNQKNINNIKIKILKKNLKEKKLVKELSNSASIFLFKSSSGISIINKNFYNNFGGGFIFARIDF